MCMQRFFQHTAATCATGKYDSLVTSDYTQMESSSSLEFLKEENEKKKEKEKKRNSRVSESCLCTSRADVTFTTHVESPHRMASVSSMKYAKHDDGNDSSEEKEDNQGDDDDDLSIATITDEDEDDNDGEKDNLAAR